MQHLEDQIIDLVKKSFTVPEYLKGAGDDCAVIPQKNHFILVTTDSLVENVHFLRDKISPFDLGYKSLNASFSDIAAMGGISNYCFCSLSIPKDISIEWVEGFTQGIKNAAEEIGVFVLGGDTTESEKDIFINVTVIGEASKPIYRRTAKPGDIICVTGMLGESKAGLEILLNDTPITEQNKRFVEKHNKPKANIKEGWWLGKREEVTSMMDISDGLHEDINKLVENPEIIFDKLPISDELKNYAGELEKARELAFTSGEEYCLLLTVDPKGLAKLQQDYAVKFSQLLYRIGEVKEA